MSVNPIQAIILTIQTIVIIATVIGAYWKLRSRMDCFHITQKNHNQWISNIDNRLNKHINGHSHKE